DDPDLVLILNRIREHQHSINTINANVSEIEKEISNSHQPSEDFDSLRDTYLSFWHLWRKLEFQQRRRAVQLFVKELRLFADGEDGKDKKLRLEIDLITNPSIETDEDTSSLTPVKKRKYNQKSSQKGGVGFVSDPVHYALLVILSFQGVRFYT
ncbi:MAG: hypothetical protein HN936_11410, partial [Bacteroidetes bacterium]|nr:hypothetical protein [Bacteroidota bacterium]